MVQQQLLFDESISELSVAINITDDSQFERIEQFIVHLSTGDPSVTLNPSNTVVRILSDDGKVLCKINVIIVITDVISIVLAMYNKIIITVVTVGFRQRRYTFLEGDGVAKVCVERNGSIAIPVSVTVAGSEFWH